VPSQRAPPTSNHLSLILGAIGVLLGLTSILLTILFALLGAPAGLIVAAFLLGAVLGAASVLAVNRHRATERAAAESDI
jgi:H+/Cl- antiporter ClcA